MKTIILATMVSALLVAPGRAESQTAPACGPQLPSARQLRDIGLPELTDEQLMALTRLLERQPAPVAPPAEVIESRIDGDFDGWEGETIFRLENGQVWQQNAKGAKYYFASRPRVRIAGYPATLHVDGFVGSVPVRRIK